MRCHHLVDDLSVEAWMQNYDAEIANTIYFKFDIFKGQFVRGGCLFLTDAFNERFLTVPVTANL